VPFSGAVPAALDPASLLTFDQDACTTCHPGIAIDAASLAPAEPRPVREFSHAHHMASATDPAQPGAAVQCATCHDVATSTRGELVGTLPRAQDCTMCHVHDAEHAPWTGRIHGADVASCAVCHEDRMPPLSFRRANVASAQVTLSGAQHHPDDRSCAECHLDTVGSQAPSTGLVSASGALFTIHAGNKYPADCRSCHWALPLASLGNQSPTLESRRREGASLTDFPGGTQTDGMRLLFLEGR
jgi:hypothetical protein